MNDVTRPSADSAAVDIEAVGDVADQLPLVVTVGFTGHRAVGDPDEARRLVRAALAIVGEAFDLLIASPLAESYDGAARLRLVVGQAPGADRVAAEVWREEGLGEVHAVYPFKAPTGEAAYTDRPESGDPDTRVEPTPEFAPWTGFDAYGLGLESDQAHAEVGRWLVRHADLLIGWWNGEPGKGPGGVADTMIRALDRGLPVIWLQPGDGRVRLIAPGASRRHADAAEAIKGVGDLAGPLSSQALAELLRPALSPPGDPESNPHDPEVVARLDYVAVDPLRVRPGLYGLGQRFLNRTLWRSYRLFESLAGREPPIEASAPPIPPGLSGEPGFARLQAASAEAGARADELSAIHRSQQLLLIVLAIAAVLVGALPPLLTAGLDNPPRAQAGATFARAEALNKAAADAARAAASVHAGAAGVEFCLGLLAAGVAFTARRAHRHRRWSDARRLAERLRGAIATWPLGFDVADGRLSPPQTWTEWRVRAVLRAAGPRRGWLTRERFARTADWAAGQLIDSQIAYHDRQRRVAHRIERVVRGIEGGSFAVLMLTLAGYVALVVGLRLAQAPPPPPTISALVTLLSAVSPAIGAGCLALDATNGFGEIALHSERLKSEFEHRRRELGGGVDEYHHVQAVIRSAAQLLRDENDAWRDSLLRRRIVRA